MLIAPTPTLTMSRFRVYVRAETGTYAPDRDLETPDMMALAVTKNYCESIVYMIA